MLAGLIFVTLTLFGVRTLVNLLPNFQNAIVRYLDEHFGISMDVSHLQADWNGGSPVLLVKQVSVQKANELDLSMESLSLQLNLRDSLLYKTVVFNYIRGNDIKIRAERGEGCGFFADKSTGKDGRTIQQSCEYYGLLRWLKRQGEVDIVNLSMELFGKQEASQLINIPFITFTQQTDKKVLQARVEQAGGWFVIDGAGDRELKNWQGMTTLVNANVKHACPFASSTQNAFARSRFSGEASWRFMDGQWQLSGQLSLLALGCQIPSSGDRKVKGRVDFAASAASDSFKLTLNEIVVNLDDKHYQLGDWYVAQQSDPEQAITIANKTIDIARMIEFLRDVGHLSSGTTALLNDLNLRGILRDFAIRLFPYRKVFDFDLSAQLDGVAVDAWDDSPSASNISGALRMSLLKGYLDLDAEQFSLGLPELFPETWHYDQAQARLYWDVIDQVYILKSDKIVLQGDGGTVTGTLRLDIPFDERLTSMALTVGLKDGSIPLAKKYIPTLQPSLSDELTDWLDQALQQGEIHAGGFVYNGILAKTDTPNDATWGLYFDVSDGIIEYHPDWPAVQDMSGKIFVNNKKVVIQKLNGNVLGAQLGKASVVVPLTGDTTVFVDGQVRSSKNTLHRLLTETPLDDFMGGVAQNWQLSGNLRSYLNMAIPLSAPSQSTVNLKGKVKNYQFAIPENDILFDQITGDIAFSTDSGLRAKSLQGTLFDQAVKASIVTDKLPSGSQVTNVNWHGQLNGETISQWLLPTSQPIASGLTDYKANLLINNQKSSNLLTVQTDLTGVSIDLPAPLNKAAETSQELMVAYDMSERRRELMLSLQDVTKAELHFDDSNRLSHGAVAVGARAKASADLDAAPENTVLIQGTLPTLDLKAWQQWLNSQTIHSNPPQFIDWPAIDGLSIDTLHYGGYTLKGVKAGINPGKHSLKLTTYSDLLAGSLWIPENKTQPYLLALDYLIVPDVNKQTSEVNVSDTKISPLSIPSANISVGSLTIGQKAVDQLSLKLRKIPDGIKVEALKADVSGMTVKGVGQWSEIEGEQYSSIDTIMEGSTIDAIQKTMGSSFVTADSAGLLGKFSWQGAPTDSRLANISGVLGVHMKNGRLNKLEGGAEALKLFGLLSTEAFSRRLRLDFSDLYAKGISFDSLDGELRFDNGMITFSEPLLVNGPSSTFKLDGEIDGNNQKLDMNVVVTLPVTSNLPVFSVLLGVKPELAGVLYLANKIIGKEVEEQIGSIRYAVKGAFDNPNIELEKLNSDKASNTNATQ